MQTGPCWENNIATLLKHRPVLYKEWQTLLPSDETVIETRPSRSGFPTAVVTSPETGRQAFLHSTEDPVREAEVLVDSLELKNGEIRCLMGMGLGYLLKEALKRDLIRHTLLVVEASPKVFEAALHQVDLTDVLASDQFEIMFDLGAVAAFLESKKVSVYRFGLPISTYEPARELYPTLYTRATRKIREEAMSLIGFLGSDKALGRPTFDNIVHNYTDLLESANMGVLVNTMSDRPGVVVGAGPSLNAQIPVLKKYIDRIFLVAVDSALPVLLKHDVKPHMVATLDYSEACYDKFRHVVDDIGEVPLCYAAAVNPNAVKMYPAKEKFFMSEETGLAFEMRDMWGAWSTMPPMQAVGHLAFVLTERSGVNQIILCGFDMAYTNFASHADGMSLPRNINLENSIWVKSIDGQMVPTMFQMIGQRTIMEMYIEHTDTPCFNANTQGAKIEGADPCDLETLLSALPEPELLSFDIVSKKYSDAEMPEAGKVVLYLKKRIRELSAARKDAQSTLKLAAEVFDQIKAHIDDDRIDPPVRALKGLKKILAGYEKIQQFLIYNGMGEITHILAGIDMDHQVAEMDIEITDEELNPNQKVLREVQILRESVGARAETLTTMIQALTRFRDRLAGESELLQAIDQVRSHPQKVRKLKAKLSALYSDYGDLRKAEIVCLDMLKEDPSDTPSMANLSEILRRQKRHKAVRSLLDSAPVDAEELQLLAAEEMVWADGMVREAEAHLRSSGASVGTLPWSLKILNEVLDVFPDHPEALRMKAVASEKSDAAARELLKEIQILDGPEAGVADRIYKLKEEGQTEFAARMALILSKKFPKSSVVRELLGLICVDGDNKPKAKEFFFQSISLDPSRIEPKVHVGSLLAEEGQYEEARGYFMEAINAEPKQTRFLHEIVGDLSFELGLLDEAIVSYEKSFISFPDHHHLLNKIGQAYSELGNNEAADAAFAAFAQVSEKKGN